MRRNVAAEMDMCVLIPRKQKSERRIACYNFDDRLVLNLIG